MPIVRSFVALFALLALAGCVSTLPISTSQGTQRDTLGSHVAFLSQPRLKGRKAGTSGSRLARQYIAARFQAAGLTPWGTAPHFDQSFGYGQNVVGVLPGSDPDLKQEIVLVCAHYDHLGRNGTGKIHPGAADNAAGVAALLETARQLSLPGQRPKRSVAFAAFDCEEWMLVGSFAFSLRKDVQDARIAAVINADILGRDFMDVVPHTLFVAGTEEYPDIRQTLKQFGSAAGIAILPLGTDLIGPRSDHVAFESRGVPCLFFSSGTFKDYHQPTDTADKLNYADLEASAKVILAAVKDLAARPTAPAAAKNTPRHSAQAADAEELQTIKIVMAEVNAHREAAGVKDRDVEAFTKLAKHADTLLQSGQYSHEARASLISEATGILAPYFLPFDPKRGRLAAQEDKDLTMGLRCLHQFYSLHRLEVLDGYRKLVAEVLKHHPGPFRSMPMFDHQIYKLEEQALSLGENINDSCSLHAFAIAFNVRAGSRPTKWLVKTFGVSMSLGFDPIDCEGTRQQLHDLCLLRLRLQQSNKVYSVETKKVLRAITGATPSESYKGLLDQRLRESGFRDEIEWIANCMSSDCAELALQALAVPDKDPRLRDAACKVLLNQSARGDVRAAAVRFAAGSPNRSALLALCDVLDDSTRISLREYTPQLKQGYPFANKPLVQTLQPYLERQNKQASYPSRTIGALARAQLRKVAKKDYGQDAARWRKWVQAS